MRKRKPMGYWQNLENVLAETRQVMKKHDFKSLPSERELRNLKYFALTNAITRHHDGYRAFRKHFGEKPKMSDSKQLKDRSYILKEIEEMMKKHKFKTLPTQRELHKLGYFYINHAIQKYHGGMHEFRKSIGEEPKLRKPNTWADIGYAIQEAKRIMKKYNVERLPTTNRLWKLGESAFVSGVRTHHGGFNEFRKVLGEELTRHPDGEWEDQKYAIKEAKRVMKEHGFETLPAQQVLNKINEGALAAAIPRCHGGYRAFRKLLGEDQKKRKDGLWKDLNYTVKQTKALMRKHKLKILPNADKLRELGHSSLALAISINHGGYHEFRKKLGEESLHVKSNTWKSLEYTIKQAKELIQKHKLKTLPNQQKITKLGYSSLCYAISKYHRGLYHFRQLLGEEPKRGKVGAWKDLSYTIQQVQEVMQKHSFETLPSPNKLKELGYGALSTAISRHHNGYVVFRELLCKKLGIKSQKQELTELLKGYLRQ